MKSTRITVDPKLNVIIPKKTLTTFILTELLVYISQIFIFFMVAVFASHMLSEEKALVTYVDGKINEHSLSEVGFVILGVTVALGILAMLKQVLSKQDWLEEISEEVLYEASRAIYFFGSSVTGALIATAIFVGQHPAANIPGVAAWVSMSLIFGLGSFAYGCFASWVFKRKRFILS